MFLQNSKFHTVFFIDVGDECWHKEQNVKRFVYQINDKDGSPANSICQIEFFFYIFKIKNQFVMGKNSRRKIQFIKNSSGSSQRLTKYLIQPLFIKRKI